MLTKGLEALQGDAQRLRHASPGLLGIHCTVGGVEEVVSIEGGLVLGGHDGERGTTTVPLPKGLFPPPSFHYTAPAAANINQDGSGGQMEKRSECAFPVVVKLICRYIRG